MSIINRCLIATTTAALTCAALAQPPVAQTPLKSSSRTRAPKLMTPADILAPLKEEGVEFNDLTGEFPPEQLAKLRDFSAYHGATDIYIFRMSDTNNVIAVWVFLDERPVEANARFHEGALRFKKSVILPAACSKYVWQQVVDALQQHGAILNIDQSSEAHATLSMLQTLRAQIELYSIQNGQYPEFTSGEWTALLNDDYIPHAPHSALSKCPDPTKIIVLSESGKSGRDIMRGEAGWVWNEADNLLYVAGYDETELQNIVNGQAGAIDYIFQVRSTYAVTGPEWARELAVKDWLGSVRGKLEQVREKQSFAGLPPYPSFQDMRQDDGPFAQMLPNPFNGSSRIQEATWDPQNPPVNGTAGWNYDPAAGEFWANTTIANANTF